MNFFLKKLKLYKNMEFVPLKKLKSYKKYGIFLLNN